MPDTLIFTGTLTITHCGVCQIRHAIPDEMYWDRRNNGGEWFCPNGHELHFITTEADKLREQLEKSQRATIRERARADSNWDEVEYERRSKAAVKGHLTRMRNLVAAGVCPVPGCKRNFANVRGHMERMHPEFHLDEEDVS